jgi:hypothetical protein
MGARLCTLGAEAPAPVAEAVVASAFQGSTMIGDVGAQIDGPDTGTMGLASDDANADAASAGPEGMGICEIPETAAFSPLPNSAELEPVGNDAEGWVKRGYVPSDVN